MVLIFNVICSSKHGLDWTGYYEPSPDRRKIKFISSYSENQLFELIPWAINQNSKLPQPTFVRYRQRVFLWKIVSFCDHTCCHTWAHVSPFVFRFKRDIRSNCNGRIRTQDLLIIFLITLSDTTRRTACVRMHSHVWPGVCQDGTHDTVLDIIYDCMYYHVCFHKSKCIMPYIIFA